MFFFYFSAPQPMVKPDFYGVVKSAEIQVILPQASEEYGPISHYYLIVVPEDKLNAQKNPDQFLTEEASSAVSRLASVLLLFFFFRFPNLFAICIHTLNTISKLCVEKRGRVEQCSVAPLRDKRLCVVLI
jgi:hypothetical protein